MNLSDIVEKLQELNLPPGSFIVVGSGTLAALGIRDTDDIDMVVSPEIYQAYKTKGWREQLGATGNMLVAHDVFEMGPTWNDPANAPNLTALLADALWVKGIPFTNIERVLDWKKHRQREKDLRDIELIEHFLNH